MSDEVSQIRFLVIPARESAPSPGLSALLEEQGWPQLVQSDPYIALADLLLERKGAASRLEWGLEGKASIVLVVEDHQQQLWWPDLLHSIQQFLPHMVVYGYEQGELVQQTHPIAEVVPTPLPTIPVPAISPGSTPPPLRIASSSTAPPPECTPVVISTEEEVERPAEDTPPPLTITQEELAMLLDPTPPESDGLASSPPPSRPPAPGGAS